MLCNFKEIQQNVIIVVYGKSKCGLSLIVVLVSLSQTCGDLLEATVTVSK